MTPIIKSSKHPLSSIAFSSMEDTDVAIKTMIHNKKDHISKLTVSSDLKEVSVIIVPSTSKDSGVNMPVLPTNPISSLLLIQMLPWKILSNQDKWSTSKKYCLQLKLKQHVICTTAVKEMLLLLQSVQWDLLQDLFHSKAIMLFNKPSNILRSNFLMTKQSLWLFLMILRNLGERDWLHVSLRFQRMKMVLLNFMVFLSTQTAHATVANKLVTITVDLFTHNRLFSKVSIGYLSDRLIWLLE